MKILYEKDYSEASKELHLVAITKIILLQQQDFFVAAK